MAREGPQPEMPPFGLAVSGTADDAATLVLSGRWILHRNMPDPAAALAGVAERAPSLRTVRIDADAVERWDDALIAFVLGLKDLCDARGLGLDLAGLPASARRLVDLASAVPERTAARRGATARPGAAEAVGRRVQSAARQTDAGAVFVGELVMMAWRFLGGRAVYRRRDLWTAVEECSADALPIVTIIAALVGMILGFVGAVQLEQFGAGIYVADLVGIAMVREMGAIMTGIVLAGRTGAAYAALIGTMQGNEEIDSLVTLGVPPMDFLVLPRVLALMMMMPLLTLYADAVGIFGGWLVGAGLLELSAIAYIDETRAAISLTDIAFGVFKGVVFGAVVAVAGCFHGLRSGRSAASVGIAATSAVVAGIVWIILLDGLFAVVTTVVGI